MRRLPYWILAAFMIIMAVFLPKLAPKSTDPPAHQIVQQAESGGPSASAAAGEKTVTLTADEQERLGVRIVTLQAASTQRRITALAMVLPAQSLATARDTYVSAQASLAKTQVNLGVAQQEYARVRALYEDNQNVSQKQLQAAHATVVSSAIDLRAASQQLALQVSLVRQDWGETVAKWVEGPSPALNQVLAQDEMLVRVSLTGGEPNPPPSTVWLALPGGKQRRARYISPLPQIDPRVQGISLLYLAAAFPGLAPGVTLTAQLPVGRKMRGMLVPASAVVWSNGVAWVYVQATPGHFTRRSIATSFPVDGGYFVTQNFSPGDKIVVSGAQILLSAEFSPPPSSSSGESDQDDDD